MKLCFMHVVSYSMWCLSLDRVMGFYSWHWISIALGCLYVRLNYDVPYMWKFFILCIVLTKLSLFSCNDDFMYKNHSSCGSNLSIFHLFSPIILGSGHRRASRKLLKKTWTFPLSCWWVLPFDNSAYYSTLVGCYSLNICSFLLFNLKTLQWQINL